MLTKEEVERVIKPNPELKFLKKEDIIKEVQESGALMVNDHFELLGRQHSSIFFKFSLLDGNKNFTGELGKELSEHFKGVKVDAVIVPVTAGLYLGTRVAIDLGVPTIQVEVDEEGRPLELADDFELSKGDRILIINDLSTTGTGVEVMVKIVEEDNGATVAGIGLFAVRGKAKEEKIHEWKEKYKNVFAIMGIEADHHDNRTECPLCKKGLRPKYSKDLHWERN